MTRTDRRTKPRGRSFRSRGRGLFFASAAASLLLVLTPGQAAAYIDPITGSIILQVLAAAGLGALLTMRRVWSGLTGACTRIWDGITQRWRQ